MIVEQHVAKICDGDLVFKKDVGDDGYDLIGKLCEMPIIVEMIQSFLIHGMDTENANIKTSDK